MTEAQTKLARGDWINIEDVDTSLLVFGPWYADTKGGEKFDVLYLGKRFAPVFQDMDCEWGWAPVEKDGKVSFDYFVRCGPKGVTYDPVEEVYRNVPPEHKAKYDKVQEIDKMIRAHVMKTRGTAASGKKQIHKTGNVIRSSGDLGSQYESQLFNMKLGRHPMEAKEEKLRGTFWTEFRGIGNIGFKPAKAIGLSRESKCHYYVCYACVHSSNMGCFAQVRINRVDFTKYGKDPKDNNREVRADTVKLGCKYGDLDASVYMGAPLPDPEEEKEEEKKEEKQEERAQFIMPDTKEEKVQEERDAKRTRTIIEEDFNE